MKRQLTAAFICLSCRRVFKRPSHRRVGDRYEALTYSPLCPHCRTELHKVGDAFRVPARDDLSAWEEVARDLDRGRTFARDEGFGQPPIRQKLQRKPKGVRSLFQLPARKRGKKNVACFASRGFFRKPRLTLNCKSRLNGYCSDNRRDRLNPIMNPESKPMQIVVLPEPNGDIIAKIDSLAGEFRLAPSGEVHFRYRNAPTHRWYVNRSMTAFLEAVRVFNKCCEDVFQFFAEDEDAEPEAMWVLERLRSELGNIEPLGAPETCLWRATVEDADGGLLRLF